MSLSIQRYQISMSISNSLSIVCLDTDLYVYRIIEFSYNILVDQQMMQNQIQTFNLDSNDQFCFFYINLI